VVVVPPEDGVTAASIKRRKLGRSVAWAVGILAAFRLVIPVSPAGYWRGSYFDCLCSAEMVGEFCGSAAQFHLLLWESDDLETHPWGSYKRSGWNSFSWTQPPPYDTHQLMLKPGWLFCRIVDPRSGQVWWAIREFNFFRLFRIHQLIDARPKTAASQQCVP
jgi:hypothetical protein